MSYSVEELKVMLKKALATAKANRLNLEEVLEENSILRAQVAGLQARVSDQEDLYDNIAAMRRNTAFSAGKQNSMEYMMSSEYNKRNR
jgi:regulator of replication initiation timing